MGNLQYENQKVKLKFSKKQINRAAQAIRHKCEGKERELASEMIQNFREIHMYPLMLMKNHLRRTANKVSNKIIVARRYKRLSTIIDKLERDTLDGVNKNSIQLTRMQDIGGCRAITKNIKDLLALKRRLEKSRSTHKIVKTNDYLSPKPSGYGGVHLIYSCFHDSEDQNDYKRTKIEVQLRTELQHAWATSLEILDTFEATKLKTSMTGNEDIREYFKIVGNLVAFHEGTLKMPKDEVLSLRKRLNELEYELRIVSKIGKYSLALRAVNFKEFEKRKHMSGIFLVNIGIDFEPKLVIRSAVKFYENGHLLKALTDLKESEKSEHVQVSVLASASDIRSLKKAYPNYFGSTGKFSRFVGDQIKFLNET